MKYKPAPEGLKQQEKNKLSFRGVFGLMARANIFFVFFFVEISFEEAVQKKKLVPSFWTYFLKEVIFKVGR